ncbi:MAG: triose-phosphate isomerase [Gemmatimonadaceae bacterium]|nr:triose-phosphate isomerase [Gemmatimonadaceae bacterium]
MRPPILAANWKMHHGPTAARAFIAELLARHTPRADRTIVLFPPALSLHAAAEARADRTDIRLGVQNIHWESKGAFTGETSAGMARDAGAELALVGHSERRHVFGETDEETSRKCTAAHAAGLVPMLCVGERLGEREAGETEAVVLRQLRAGLTSLEAGARRSVMIAYEPVWAIGTGKTATPDDAAAVHAVIRQELQVLAPEGGSEVPILYGGSVNPGNAAALLAAPEVGGLLVGGASLEVAGWLAIAST